MSASPPSASDAPSAEELRPGTPEELAQNLLLPAARETMAREIATVNGDEVFFIGRLDAEMRVEEVEAYAYGNRSAVPALMQHARPGDVMLHNHPSGVLEPSNADIGVSSVLGQRGIGSYIINNDCTRLRIVVRALKPSKVEPLNLDAIGGWLAPGGRIAERLEGYEHRPQQLEMLRTVGEAFNSNGIAVIEAGTGVGKSLAYLLPAVTWALKNQEKVIVSTGTINLQEQLITKDLPLLARATGLKFEATLLKGRNNYLCRRKAEYLRRHPDFGDAGEKQAQLDQIFEWIDTTRDGSREDLPFTPDGDVWERVMSESDNCLRTQCPFYQKCFFYQARRAAGRAQILVVNHHLLLADLAVRAETGNYTMSAVLPPFQRIVFDEAHHIEDIATEYFGARTTRHSILYTMRRLVHPRKQTGVLAYLASKIHEGVYELSPAEHDELLLALGRDLLQRHHDLQSAVEDAAEQIAEAIERKAETPPGNPMEVKRRIREADLESEFWLETIEAPLRSILTTARPYLEGLQMVGRKLRRFLENTTPELASPILELSSTFKKLEGHIVKLTRFLGSTDGQCRWIEYRRPRSSARNYAPAVTWAIAPLEIADQFREQVLRRYNSVIMTSATLAVGGRFDYFNKQIGANSPERLSLLGPVPTQAPPEELAPLEASLERRGSDEATGREATAVPENPPLSPAPEALPPEGPARALKALLLDTPFDYASQAYIAVPADLPDPGEMFFDQALIDFLGQTLETTRGRALVLFTSYSLLQRAFEAVAPRLERLGYPCLRQGQGGRSMLTEQFRQGIGSVLFATASFWEGVDIAGESLSCLVLTRLPFRVPNEPLLEARIEELRRRNIDPFMNLTVPQAVIKFRQGFGRLIRSHSDRGAVLICDRRVMTKRYGKVFIDSLPPAPVHHVPSERIGRKLEAFLQ